MSGATKALRKRVAFVRSQAANLRPAVEAIGQQWRADRKRDFRSQGATTASGAWRPNKASTIAGKGHARILRGNPKGGFQLYKSIVNRRHTDHVFRWQQGDRAIEIGTKHWKARIHQLGLGRGGVRKPIDPTAADRKRYTSILSRWVLRGKLP